MLISCLECKKPIFVSSVALADGDVELGCHSCSIRMSVNSFGVVELSKAPCAVKSSAKESLNEHLGIEQSTVSLPKPSLLERPLGMVEQFGAHQRPQPELHAENDLVITKVVLPEESQAPAGGLRGEELIGQSVVQLGRELIPIRAEPSVLKSLQLNQPHEISRELKSLELDATESNPSVMQLPAALSIEPAELSLNSGENEKGTAKPVSAPYSYSFTSRNPTLLSLTSSKVPLEGVAGLGQATRGFEQSRRAAHSSRSDDWEVLDSKPCPAGSRALLWAVLGVGLIWFVNAWRYGNLPKGIESYVDRQVAVWMESSVESDDFKGKTLDAISKADVAKQRSTRALPTVQELVEVTKNRRNLRPAKLPDVHESEANELKQVVKPTIDNLLKPTQRLPSSIALKAKTKASPAKEQSSSSSFGQASDRVKPKFEKMGSAPTRKKIPLPPSPPDIGEVSPTVSRVQAYYQKGNRFLSESKPVLALDEFRAAIALSPKFEMAYRSLAIASIMVGDNKGAATAYRRFIELAPNHRDAPKIKRFLQSYQTQ